MDFHISLDIHESNAQAALRIKKGDTARRILITLTENGKPYEISRDCKAVFTARKPDGHLLYNACTVQGNRIIYALTAQTAAVAGEVRCELRLYGADSALITSPRFLLLVDDTVYSDGDLVESSAEFSELTQMVNKVETLKTEIEEALKNGDFKGETGETSLPVARAESNDGIAYTATDAGS
ncbi:MAG: BppU family phage baseplate upper protein, partial [Faecousia sp.]